jgi:cellulose synthase/poly-beta-1,6-N-acetylglucosamine synthase-like glycosyltransferase
MGFASDYLQRHRYFGPFIPAAPERNTSLIVVIPCFSEPDIIETLASLYKADRPSFSLEVIVAVNSPMGADQSYIIQNKQSLQQINCWSKKFSCPGFTVHAIDVPPFPVKHAGAGFARKAGMDEAVGRFNLLNNKNGIIVSFDADSTCDANYFTELEKCFAGSPTRGCTIYFEHPLHMPGSMDINYPILRYELYLRYFIEAMRLSGFPWAFHTIGSCFAVTAGVYAMQGGMNRKKAGEDFYFLHKVFPLGNFKELNSTRVVPSSRVSDRVHFGTGAGNQKTYGQPG